ncbi:Flagellar hook-basal body complex protein FliE [bacterium HR17]|jgi:flagellar hook-basal body complex protein FliE|uniref:Flagellar hook-basal body complex protein FliE n=1 Tax=Candidatus Fervidibacter japonicus TaxID=2035412 RepID=A0A2H5XCS4_9BACT|nr:Flagellar hook-basal body complex protein FliE [bacterium HR17]
MPLESVRALQQGQDQEAIRPTTQVVKAFTEALRGLLQEVDEQDAQAAELKRRLLVGEPVQLHELLLAAEKAHLSFQLLLSVRNRLLEAYQELTRTPL